MVFSNPWTRRVVLTTLTLAAAAALLPIAAHAQGTWPARPIKLIVPFAPGGGTDPIARSIGSKLSARLGQPVIIENRGGAGGTLGTEAVAKSVPDGLTLLFASTSITTNVASGKKLAYDLEKDLQPIGQVGASPLLFVVSSTSKMATMKDLLDAARAKQGTITYGSGGLGAISHLGVELLANDAKVQFVHIPYKGIAPALTDLVGGNIHTLTCSPATCAPLLQSEKIRILGVTSAQRSPFTPKVPTVAEAGVPGFQLEFWWGLLGPTGMPPDVVKRLNAELNWALSQPDVRELLARESAAPKPGTPDEFRKLISFEIGRWNKLVKDANLKIE